MDQCKIQKESWVEGAAQKKAEIIFQNPVLLLFPLFYVFSATTSRSIMS